MILKDFYDDIFHTEESAVAFLREKNLLESPQNAKPCHKCGSKVRDTKIRSRGIPKLTIRCVRKGCQSSRSIRQGNPFFYCTDKNNRPCSNLSLCEILELVYFFVMDIPMNTTVTLTGKSSATVTAWFNKCREICGSIISRRGKMVGTSVDPIQIDEKAFAGEKKCRGKKLNDDNTLSEDIDRSWVFGLKQNSDCRYFYIKRRDKDTILPIIQRECEVGSVIHSVECPAYGNLNDIGYNHLAIDRKRNSEDPITEANMQAIEKSFSDAKDEILKKLKGVPNNTFQSHLDHFCWKISRKDSVDLFFTFLDDLSSVYR